MTSNLPVEQNLRFAVAANRNVVTGPKPARWDPRQAVSVRLTANAARGIHGARAEEGRGGGRVERESQARRGS